MYFWAEKYFSGSNLEQQQNQRRGSRSGSGNLLERKGSFRDGGAPADALAEHRKSVGQVGAQRRESRTKDGGGTQGAGSATGPGQQQQKAPRKFGN